ncbi:MAG TPA: biotin--[acetyl-CoA-carboxylase] ligase, partial [Ilumatobacteraceae bacterium]|nr:biotin--[acetyl-CoA-carboxylase] ligase [Ilumatobacteraceae bacterium]
MSTTWHVSRVAVTGSTNDDLLAAGRDGAAHGTVLMADLQTAGRGRLDRRWDAPAGANLLVSLLLRDLGAAPHEAVRRVALAARAAAETAGQTAHGASEIVLKWPNDLLVRGADDSAAKLAGILAQLGHSSTGPFVVVGVGMNIGWGPEGAARL